MQFLCRYGTEDGKVEQKIVNADTKEAAVTILKRENIIIYEIKPQRGYLFFLRRKRTINRDEFMVFIRELIALLRAGLPLTQSLDILIKRRKEGDFLTILQSVRENVKSGVGLADSFREHKEFSNMFTSLVETGEKSGELPKVLERYLNYAEKFDEMRRKLISALIYPAILISLSVFLIFIMLTYVIPRFVGFYENSEKNLPWITRSLIGFSSFITGNILLILLIIAAAVVVFRYWKETPSGRLKLDKFKLSVPMLGPLWSKYSINQFCRSLSVMLSSGIPLLNALGVTTRTITNRYVSGRVSTVIDDVNEGEALHSSLEKTEVFSDMAIEMIQVGEQTGSLESMLNQLGEYYDRDIDLAIDRLLRALEPLFLILMGIIIAGMLLAMYLPIFRAGSMIM